MDETGAYQGIVGIVGRLWDQDNVIALTLGEMIHANIHHNLSPGQSFGRHVVFKIANVLEARRGQPYSIEYGQEMR